MAGKEALNTGDGDKKSVSRKNKGLSLSRSSIVFAVITTAAVIAFIVLSLFVSETYRKIERLNDESFEAQNCVIEFLNACDYLTNAARSFVITGESHFLDEYMTEVKETKSREKALERLAELTGSTGNGSAYNFLNSAYMLSLTLAEREYLVLKLVVESSDTPLLYNVPSEIENIQLNEYYRNMSAEERRESAGKLLYDAYYLDYKDQINKNANICDERILESFSKLIDENNSTMHLLLRTQLILAFIVLILNILYVIFIRSQVRRPLSRIVSSIKRNEYITAAGASEMRFLSDVYNDILKENIRSREELSYEAAHDGLTGLFNRASYDAYISRIDQDTTALMLIDIDKFKDINDVYGHQTGDRVLRKTADMLVKSFRPIDIVCRIGGDEFAVIIRNVSSSMSRTLVDKIDHLNQMLLSPDDGLPAVSVSAGVAFSDKFEKNELPKNADIALYNVKKAGRCGCRVAEPAEA